MLALPDLEAAFFAAVTGASSTSAVLPEVRGDARLDAAGRVDVYARMYLARLVDVLFEDYPRVAVVVGPDAFAALARAYVAAHPSTHPSLRWFGRDVPEFIDAVADREDLPAYLADLARLEWTRRAVFDAPDATPLGLAALRAVPPDAWATLRLRLIPALEVLRAGWPVHRIWDADAAAPSDGWQPVDACLRVWRRDDAVYQAPMDEAERVALARVRAGDDFAGVCEALAAVVSVDRAPETAAGLVLRWIEDGIVAGAASAA